MFDFYDGGGLDITSLSFAEIDRFGNVNVHAFPGRVRGPGGFPNISARTGRINFVGTLNARGLELGFDGGRLQIKAEGTLPKFVADVQEISFSGEQALARGQQVRFITERAVFALREEGVTLIEIAEGLDVQRDVIDQMGFAPQIADDLRPIDPRVYGEAVMGLAR
jgi:propionate CoA-transferase